MTTARPASNHIAAIHALKNKLRMSDGDYRALLLHLTGKDSSKAMTQAERARVRDHMQQMALRAGLEPPGRPKAEAAPSGGSATRAAVERGGQPFVRADQRPQYVKAARPLERKVWALWGALGRAGKLDNPSNAGLQAWVQRQLGLSHVHFCNDTQLHQLIESLKLWQGR